MTITKKVNNKRKKIAKKKGIGVKEPRHSEKFLAQKSHPTVRVAHF